MQGDQRGLCRHGLGKSMDRLGLGSLLFETEEKERERQNEWMDGQMKEGRKEKPQGSTGLRRALLSLSGNF